MSYGMWPRTKFGVLCLIFIPAVLSRQVGFMMTRGRVDGTYINFEIVATNVHAELSREVGAFRCTEPGLYYFTFSAIAPRDSSLRVSLRKNRIPMVTLFASANSHTSVMGSMVLLLIKNDIVYPFVEDGQIYESVAKTRALTSFSGFRVNGVNRDEFNSVFRTDAEIIENEVGEPDPDDKIYSMFQSTINNDDSLNVYFDSSNGTEVHDHPTASTTTQRSIH